MRLPLVFYLTLAVLHPSCVRSDLMILTATDSGASSWDAAVSLADAAGSDPTPTVDATPPSADAGANRCGSRVCRGSELCVRPCCGGAVPLCLGLALDGGTCPAGTVWTTCSTGQGTTWGCAAACVPPPPFCAEVEPGCDPHAADVCQSCFRGDPCYPAGGTCAGRIDSETIACVCS